MIPSHSPQQNAVASQLRAELDAYEEGLDRLLQRQWDPDLYRALCDRFDRIQMYSHAFPRLSLPFTELLISRAELVHALWTMRIPGRISGKVVACHAQHRLLIDALRRLCPAVPETAAAPSNVAGETFR